MSLDFSLEITADVGTDTPHVFEVFEGNITHNLNAMAEACGLYEVLWRPDENGYVEARDIIRSLASGIEELKRRPDFYKRYELANGWGKYDDFVTFADRVLDACQQYPAARIKVWR